MNGHAIERDPWVGSGFEPELIREKSIANELPTMGEL